MTRCNSLWRQLLLAAIMLLALLALGCGAAEPQASAPSATGYQVKDSTGYTLQLQQKPKRIVSLSVGTDEILMDLVDLDRVLAVTYLADDPSISNVTEQVKKVPLRFSGRSNEGLLEANPDLVLIPDYVPAENYQIYRDVGVNVYVYKNPANLQEIKDCIREIAAVVGEPERGEAVVQQMEARMQTLQQQLGTITAEQQKKVLHVGATGAYYAPKGTFRDVCTQAKVKDVTSALEYDQTCLLSQEVIVSLNPDSFVIADWNYDGKNPPEALRDELLQNQSYSTTNAGKNGSVLVIPAAHLLSCSQYFVLAVEDMAKAAYPERF